MDMAVQHIRRIWWNLALWPMNKKQARILFHDGHGFTSEIKAELHHAGGGFVMVSKDQDFLAWEFRENPSWEIRLGYAEVSKVIDNIIWFDSLAPTVNHGAVHVTGVFEGARTIGDDVGMSEMCVGDYPAIHKLSQETRQHGVRTHSKMALCRLHPITGFTLATIIPLAEYAIGLNLSHVACVTVVFTTEEITQAQAALDEI